MYTAFWTKTLKTGGDMQIGVVTPPEDRFAGEIIPLLAHKGQPWGRHIREALAGRIPELETRFYIGHLDGSVIANIMTVEYNRTGILGHVFTAPEHRRKGACRLVMTEQMEDFRRRGGGLLLLETEFESPAYWIYHGLGFRSVYDGWGFMRYATEGDFEACYFAQAPTRPVDVQWKDWPRWNVIGAYPGGDYLRSIALGWWGMRNFEGGFLRTKLRIDQGETQVRLLESDRGSIVGFASLEADPRWKADVALLDFFVHPNFEDRAAQLLEALRFPDDKVQCYADSASRAKIETLHAAGFEQEAVLKGQVKKGADRLDVLVLAKRG